MRQETPTFHGHLLSLMKYLGWNISWKVLTTQSNSTFGSCWCWNIGNNVCLIVSYYQLFSGCCQIFKQNKSFFFLSFLICKTLLVHGQTVSHFTCTLLNSWHLHAPTITKIINDPYSYYNIIKLSFALKYAILHVHISKVAILILHLCLFLLTIVIRKMDHWPWFVNWWTWTSMSLFEVSIIAINSRAYTGF